MLRITVKESESSWRIKLEGKLAAEWVVEVEKTWSSANVAGKQVELDLTQLTLVDYAGWNLLQKMSRGGATFVANGIALRTRLEEITNKKCSFRKLPLLAAALTLVIAAAPACLRAQGQSAPMPLKLHQAVQIALQQNPEVAIANLNFAKSQEKRSEARAALLPQVSLGASEHVVRENTATIFGRTIAGFPGHVGPFWTIGGGMNFSASAFDMSLINRWRAEKETVGASAADRMTARELNAQLVVAQYLGAMRAAADVEAAQSQLDLAKALLELATDLQNNGAGTSIDTLRANVEYQNEKQKHTEATTRYKIALYGLNRLLNLSPDQSIELADADNFFETPAIRVGDSLARAYEARPELRAIQSKIKASEFRKRAAADERLPKVSVGGGWNLEGLTPGSAIPVYQFGAAVNVPLFTGGRIRAMTAETDIEVKKLQQEEQETRNQIALEVKSAAAQLESARTEVETAALGVSLSEEAVRQAQDRFRAGVTNNIEIVTAQDELARANDNRNNALYRYNQARADLARATGAMEEIYAN